MTQKSNKKSQGGQILARSAGLVAFGSMLGITAQPTKAAVAATLARHYHRCSFVAIAAVRVGASWKPQAFITSPKAFFAYFL